MNQNSGTGRERIEEHPTLQLSIRRRWHRFRRASLFMELRDAENPLQLMPLFDRPYDRSSIVHVSLSLLP